MFFSFFFFQAEDGIRDHCVTGVQTCALPIFSRSGLPKGVFNLVMGRGSVVGEAFLNSRDVDAITFTGSVSTGRKVASACEIGRASCRERGEIARVASTLK